MAGGGISAEQIARETGVHAEALRFYQLLGLIPNPRRSHSRLLRYPADVLPRVWFIARAFEAGFRAEEVRDLLTLQADILSPCPNLQLRLVAKREQMQQQVEVLRRHSALLQKLEAVCQTHQNGGGCKIFETLASAPNKLPPPAKDDPLKASPNRSSLGRVPEPTKNKDVPKSDLSSPPNH